MVGKHEREEERIMTELELEWSENDLTQISEGYAEADPRDCTNSDGIIYWD